MIITYTESAQREEISQMSGSLKYDLLTKYTDIAIKIPSSRTKQPPKQACVHATAMQSYVGNCTSLNGSGPFSMPFD